MRITISSEGEIVLPAEFRHQDRIEPGQEFDIERLDRGDYRLTRRAAQDNTGVIDWLLACPRKGFFVPVESESVPCASLPRLHPIPRVMNWLRAHEPEIAVAPMILGELRFGILILPKGSKRTALERWFDTGVGRLHCLPWDSDTGVRWAQLLAHLRTTGRTMPIKDSLIAATALVHGLIVATRNRADFVNAGVRLVDPFAA